MVHWNILLWVAICSECYTDIYNCELLSSVNVSLTYAIVQRYYQWNINIWNYLSLSSVNGSLTDTTLNCYLQLMVHWYKLLRTAIFFSEWRTDTYNFVSVNTVNVSVNASLTYTTVTCYLSEWFTDICHRPSLSSVNHWHLLQCMAIFSDCFADTLLCSGNYALIFLTV